MVNVFFEERPRISRIIRKIRLRIDFDFYRISRNESRAILAALEIIRFIRCIYDAILLFVPFVQFVVVSTLLSATPLNVQCLMVNGQWSMVFSPCPAGCLRFLLCLAQGLDYFRLPGSPLLWLRFGRGFQLIRCSGSEPSSGTGD